MSCMASPTIVANMRLRIAIPAHHAAPKKTALPFYREDRFFTYEQTGKGSAPVGLDHSAGKFPATPGPTQRPRNEGRRLRAKQP